MKFSDPKHNTSKFQLGRGMRVADFGSGSGHYAIAAAEAVGSEGRVYAIEIQRPLLQKVKDLSSTTTQKSNIEVIWGDIERKNGTKLPDQSLDGVIVSNVLFQAEEKDGLIGEAYRVLRPGGRVFFIDWRDSYGGVGPAASAVIEPKRARQLFEEGKFAFEREFDAGSHHYGLVFKKA